MQSGSLSKFSASCALVYAIGSTAFFAVYIAQGNLQVDWSSGSDALSYMSGTASSGATVLQLWLSFALPVVMALAGLGFFQAMRHVGTSVVVAAVTFTVGALLFVHRGFLGVALYELGAAYPSASDDTQQTLVVTYDVLLRLWDAGNILAGVLVGVGTILFSLAIPRASFGPHWLAWLGVFVGVFGGLLWVLTPLSDAFGITVFMVNLVSFFWLSAMAVFLWRARAAPAAP